MKAIISSDPQRGAGHALVRLEGCPAVASTAFSLRRGSDMKFLSAGGWQESEMLLAPDGSDVRDGQVCLHIGPAVVDQLDPLAAYLLTLDGRRFGVEMMPLEYSSLGGQAGTMPVSCQVAPAQAEASSGVQMASPAEETSAQQAEAIPPQEEPQPEPLEHSSQEGLPTLPIEETPERRRAVWPVVLGVLVVLGLVAAAAYFFLAYDTEETPPLPAAEAAAPAAPQAPAGKDAAGPSSSDADSPAAAEQPAEAPAGSLSPIQQARQHLRGEADPAASVALAKPLRVPGVQPQDADAAFLLLEDAAQKGNAEAMYLAGQFYDPACTLPRGSIPTDMVMARKLYEGARAGGIAEAGAALATLRQHVEAEAAKGNAEARRLLQDWK